MRMADCVMAPRFRSEWLRLTPDARATLDAAFDHAIRHPGHVASLRRLRHVTTVGIVHTLRFTVGYATFVFLEIEGCDPVLFGASLDDGLPTASRLTA